MCSISRDPPRQRGSKCLCFCFVLQSLTVLFVRSCSPADTPHLPQQPGSVFFRLLRPEFLETRKEQGQPSN